MNPFGKRAEPEPPETGIEVLRRTLQARTKTPGVLLRLLNGGAMSTDPSLERFRAPMRPRSRPSWRAPTTSTSMP
jgi:hypothetical protein